MQKFSVLILHGTDILMTLHDLSMSLQFTFYKTAVPSVAFVQQGCYALLHIMNHFNQFYLLSSPKNYLVPTTTWYLPSGSIT